MIKAWVCIPHGSEAAFLDSIKAAKPLGSGGVVYRLCKSWTGACVPQSQLVRMDRAGELSLSQKVVWLGQLSHLQAGKEESGGWWWCHHNDAQTAVSGVSWRAPHKVEEDVPWASNRQMACSGESGERRQRLPRVYSVQNSSKIRKTLKWCLNFLWCPIMRNVPRAPHCVK